MKLKHQSENIPKIQTNQTLFSEAAKIIIVLICKQSLRQLKQGILPPKEQKMFITWKPLLRRNFLIKLDLSEAITW